MRRVRVIPVLTIDKGKLVKTTNFKKPRYIGDPVNAVKIFNEKEVDEVVLLDITATKNKHAPDYSKIEEICSEAFMPFAYGGGIQSMDQIDKLFGLGIEKVILNSALADDPSFVKEAVAKYGAQSIVASIDVKKNVFGKSGVYIKSGQVKVSSSLESYVSTILELGIGELILTSIDREGTYKGIDQELVKRVSTITSIPLVANGGAFDLNDFKNAIQSGATAVAASSQFIYRGNTKGILINYPTQEQLRSQVFS